MYIQLTPNTAQPYFPVTTANYLNFIAQLKKLKYAASTMTTFCSALSYVNKITHSQDPAKTFIVTKALEGDRKIKPTTDVRQPITLAILHSLIRAMPTILPEARAVTMYRAAFLIMFHAFLRVGEITVRAKGASMINVIKYKDCTFHTKQGQLDNMVVTIRNCKHHNNTDFHITIPAVNHPQCPVKVVWKYASSTPHRHSTLFHNANGSPLSRHQLDKILKTLFQAIGLSPAKYKTHSFRIGAATEAITSLSMSDSEVQHLGRWQSGAFRRYIRSPSFLKPSGR